MARNKGTTITTPITTIPLTREAAAMEALFSSTMYHNMGEGPVMPTITPAVWGGYFR